MNSYEYRIYMDKRWYMAMAKFGMMDYVDKLVIRLINEGYADADIMKIVDKPDYDIAGTR